MASNFRGLERKRTSKERGCLFNTCCPRVYLSPATNIIKGKHFNGNSLTVSLLSFSLFQISKGFVKWEICLSYVTAFYAFTGRQKNYTIICHSVTTLHGKKSLGISWWQKENYCNLRIGLQINNRINKEINCVSKLFIYWWKYEDRLINKAQKRRKHKGINIENPGLFNNNKLLSNPSFFSSVVAHTEFDYVLKLGTKIAGVKWLNKLLLKKHICIRFVSQSIEN